jgi:hypothetical protein
MIPKSASVSKVIPGFYRKTSCHHGVKSTFNAYSFYARVNRRLLISPFLDEAAWDGFPMVSICALHL